MTQEQERETLRVELAAIGTNIEKACKLASRVPACYARLVEARKNAAPDVEALEEREALALVHEFSAIIDDTGEAVLRLSACYEGFVEDKPDDGTGGRGGLSSDVQCWPRAAGGFAGVPDRAAARGGRAVRCDHCVGGGGEPAGDGRGHLQVHRRRAPAGLTQAPRQRHVDQQHRHAGHQHRDARRAHDRCPYLVTSTSSIRHHRHRSSRRYSVTSTSPAYSCTIRSVSPPERAWRAGRVGLKEAGGLGSGQWIRAF